MIGNRKFPKSAHDKIVLNCPITYLLLHRYIIMSNYYQAISDSKRLSKSLL